MSPYQKILELLSGVDYQQMEHERVMTSEQAAEVRGVSITEGMKSLLLKADDKLVLVVIRGDGKLHSNKVRHHLKVKDLRFADPETVLKTMGVEIGACYPFGNLVNVEMYVDERFKDNDYVSFNPARHDRTIRMQWSDYLRLVDPELISASKD